MEPQTPLSTNDEINLTKSSNGSYNSGWYLQDPNSSHTVMGANTILSNSPVNSIQFHKKTLDGYNTTSSERALSTPQQFLNQQDLSSSGSPIHIPNYSSNYFSEDGNLLETFSQCESPDSSSSDDLSSEK